MKKLFLSLIVVLFAFSAVGQTFQSGQFTYTVISGTTNVKVKATDPISLVGEITIPETVTNNGITYTVTEFASHPFLKSSSGPIYGRQASNMTKLILPNTMTSIIDNAFDYATALRSITFGTGVQSIGESIFYESYPPGTQIEIICLATTAPTLISCENIGFNKANPGGPNEDPDGPFGTQGCSFGYILSCDITLHYPYGSDYSTWINEFESINTIEIGAPVTYTSVPNVENANFEDASTWGVTSIQETNRTFRIAEGHQVTLNSELVLNENTTLINDGVLKIAFGGELYIDNSATASVTQNDLGIVEVSTDVLPNNKWSFIGAPFAEYKLGAIKPGSHDISISEFNYANGAWSNDWATIETEIGAGEGFFAWSWAEESTIFTNYGDVWDYENNRIGEYNPNQEPAYSINSTDVDVTKTLVSNNGNWMALANPYTFKLDIATFIADQNNSIQGEVFYRLNDNNVWQTATTGAINLTEGFFVNFVNAGSQTAHFKTTQRYTSSAKSNAEREFVRLAMLEGEREIELLFAHNEEANENYDIFDANKLFSPVEIAEPYFVTNNIALVKEEVNTLPYYATMNVRSFGNKEVKFKANYIPEGLSVSIIDGEETIDLAEGVEYTTNIVAGENADRFKVLIKKSLSLEEAEELEVNIFNNNRHINIETLESDIQVEVYNALGQKVFTTRDHNFALNNVPAGAYLIKAFNANASKTAKVIVK